ncbi:hypothetical protein BX661DRAFT_176229 [Kickxella alabastrina]|uniref:uncharacterized protein n=1 Tax=Kickxella alabastrina TaxID=61397 RepID=UPI00221FD064|nr:uncharacterized protein BX661DRAFT_176229 [Kickxella alabastrina]KAI7835172.1 hypothetical protein BX661DRAFT_176229 [Kickxella alabastrina]KAJ1947575.1 SUMO1 sentrin specific peptidase 8 [Kickxella alabastrina]
MVSDAVVLDFENAEVRTSDYESLMPEGWLTGEIINFYWTYLERREFTTEPSALFLGTYTAYRISNAENSQVTDNISKQLSQELGSHRHLILIPLNHRSHWSLLIYCRLTRTFYHYDSINRHNRNFAERAAGRFLRVLEPKMKDGFYFKSMQTPQQNNDHDCGIYVLAIAEELARRYINHLRKNKSRGNLDKHRHNRVAETEIQSKHMAAEPEYWSSRAEPKETVRREQLQDREPSRREQFQNREVAKRENFQDKNGTVSAYERLNGARNFGGDIARSRTVSGSTAAAYSMQRNYPMVGSTVRSPAATIGVSSVARAQTSAPGRALASDLLMPRFGQTFSGFQNPFESIYRKPDGETYAAIEPMLKGGGVDYNGQYAPDSKSGGSGSGRTREERLKLEVDMMEKAGLPRDFWQVTVEDIEYPHFMRKRIRTLVLDLKRHQAGYQQQQTKWGW